MTVVVQTDGVGQGGMDRVSGVRDLLRAKLRGIDDSTTKLEAQLHRLEHEADAFKQKYARTVGEARGHADAARSLGHQAQLMAQSEAASHRAQQLSATSHRLSDMAQTRAFLERRLEKVELAWTHERVFGPGPMTYETQTSNDNDE
jgi:DNA anti-recombination protein RmuC